MTPRLRKGSGPQVPRPLGFRGGPRGSPTQEGIVPSMDRAGWVGPFRFSEAQSYSIRNSGWEPDALAQWSPKHLETVATCGILPTPEASQSADATPGGELHHGSI